MKTYKYSKYPFIRFLLPFICGLYTASVNSLSLFFLVFFAVVFSVAFTYLTLNVRYRYSQRWINGIIINLVLFSAGLISFPRYQYGDDVYQLKEKYICKVESVQKNTESRQIVLLNCKSTSEDVVFNALGYLKTNASSSILYPGDLIVYSGCVNKVSGATNPYAFDYSKYLLNRDIIGQLYLNEDNFTLIEESFTLQRYFFKMRLWAESKLLKLNALEEDFAFLSALVLGDKSFLDYETKTSFSNAGAIHIISVSGLHVGIIYLMLVGLLGWMDKGLLRNMKFIIMLLVLWFYAGITGMSPSVLRATIMFSVFIIGKIINYQYNIYHSMGIAAFIILLIDPYSIINAGFWLSFIAVASIVYFYPLINCAFYFTSPWAKYLWSIVSVSVAAQIGTAPLVTYLFGFFPTWFLLANLFIVPLLPLLLIGGVAVIVFPVGSIPSLLVKGLMIEISQFIHQFTSWVSELPHPRIITIQFEFYELLIFYIFLLFVISWINYKKSHYLIISMTVVLILIVSITIKSYKKFNQQYFVVHQIKEKTVCSLIYNGKCNFYFSSHLSNIEYDRAVFPLLKESESYVNNIVDLTGKLVQPIVIPGLEAVLINGAISNKDLLPLINNVNLIVFSSQVPTKNIEQIIQNFPDKDIVFDSSFSAFESKRLRTKFTKNCYRIYYTSLNGAFLKSNMVN